MTPDVWLALLSIGLVPFSIVCSVILWRAAIVKPHIGALTERAWIAGIIALMVISGTVITINRLNGYNLFPIEMARVLFLVSLILLEFVPVAWMGLWMTGRLGEANIARDATLARIEADLAANTVISQGARDDAHEAAEVANSVNEKIAAQGDVLVRQGREQVRERAERKAGDA